MSSLSESIALLLCGGLSGCSSEDFNVFRLLSTVLNAELLVADQLLEAGALVVRHVLLDEAARVGDLALLVDVDVLHALPEHFLVLLDEAPDSGDVEYVRVSAISEVVRQRHLLAGALRRAAVDLHLTAGVGSEHLEGDHDRRDDLVADLGGLLHVTGDDMDGVPSAALDLVGRVHDLLHEEASVEALRVCVVEVDGRYREVVV